MCCFFNWTKLWRLIVIGFTHFVDQIGSVYNMTYKRSTLVYQIEVQEQINVQALIRQSKIKLVQLGNLEIFPQINKRVCTFIRYTRVNVLTTRRWLKKLYVDLIENNLWWLIIYDLFFMKVCWLYCVHMLWIRLNTNYRPI